MGKKGVAGGKVTQSHQTCIDTATAVVVAAKKHAGVKKIVLGPIKPCGSPNTRSIKFNPLTGGIKMTVKGPHSVQDIAVYLFEQDKAEEIQNELLESFSQ